MGTIEVIQNEDCALTCQFIAILKLRLAEQQKVIDRIDVEFIKEIIKKEIDTGYSGELFYVDECSKAICKYLKGE